MAQQVQVFVWDFTAPEDGNDFRSIKRILKEYGKHWCFQLEEGSESGYKHFQGRVSLKEKTRNAAKRINKPNDLKWHWSVTSGDNTKNFNYVMKEDTRIAGPWKDTDVEHYIPRQIRGIELRPWQQRIVDDASRWDNRTINIIYDKVGNNGKSTLCTYVGAHQIGRKLPFTNDLRDIMRMVMDTPKKSLYLIDIPRALRKDQLYQFFGGVESIKDGYAYDDRYNFREEYFDCPNIWIFMNSIPERGYLSDDRWKYWVFENNDLVERDIEALRL